MRRVDKHSKNTNTLISDVHLRQRVSPG